MTIIEAADHLLVQCYAAALYALGAYLAVVTLYGMLTKKVRPIERHKAFKGISSRTKHRPF